MSNIQHLSTVDAFDPLLNDAVDLHVQSVNHHRNLACNGI
jgi:hypothetical protein